MYAQEHAALRAEIAVDAGTVQIWKNIYLTNDLLQPLATSKKEIEQDFAQQIDAHVLRISCCANSGTPALASTC